MTPASRLESLVTNTMMANIAIRLAIPSPIMIHIPIDLGFSTETLMNETQKVYQKYGEEFLDHMEEAFIEASKEAAGNMAQEVWDSVEDTIRDTF